MRFSEEFAIVARADGDDWFDAEVTEDTPLYVDPFLVFEDDDPSWVSGHDDVVAFFDLALAYVNKAEGRTDSGHWRKAERMLMFPEPKEFALGLSMGHPEGAGTGAEFAFRMADALDVLRRNQIDTLRYVDALVLFCEGMGVDRISDALCNILKPKFIKYTQEVAARHSIATGQVPVKHIDWSRTTGRWHDGTLALPESPAFRGGVLLCPKRFLKDIPRVTADGFWTWAETREAEVLRDDLNYDLAESLTQARKKAEGRRVARARPDLAFAFLDETAAANHEPYDVAADPNLLVGWAEVGRAAAAARQAALGQPANEETFLDWVRALMLEFKHAVEETDLWSVLWDDKLRQHRQEKIVQAVASTMWAAQCKAAGVDLSREVNIGRGPVDFKFSDGWQRRALTEVKLIKSTQFFSGASKQLPQYLKSESVRGGFYLAVGFTDRDFDDDRLQRVVDTCQSLSRQKDIKIEAIFVDARHDNKPSASKIKDDDRRRD